jgi:hypothetical protein
MAAKTKTHASPDSAGKARSKLGGFPGLIPHRQVAALLGITPNAIRKWVAKGAFPVPHSIFEQTWLYRVDVVRVFLDTGKWPEGTKFNRTRRDWLKS